MEFIFDLLFDIIVEGSIEIGSIKKVPMPIRIIALLVVLTIFFGLGSIIIFEGYNAYISGSMLIACIFFGLGASCIISGIFEAIKMFRKKKNRTEE